MLRRSSNVWRFKCATNLKPVVLLSGPDDGGTEPLHQDQPSACLRAPVGWRRPGHHLLAAAHHGHAQSGGVVPLPAARERPSCAQRHLYASAAHHFCRLLAVRWEHTPPLSLVLGRTSTSLHRCQEKKTLRKCLCVFVWPWIVCATVAYQYFPEWLQLLCAFISTATSIDILFSFANHFLAFSYLPSGFDLSWMCHRTGAAATSCVSTDVVAFG